MRSPLYGWTAAALATAASSTDTLVQTFQRYDISKGQASRGHDLAFVAPGAARPAGNGRVGDSAQGLSGIIRRRCNGFRIDSRRREGTGAAYLEGKKRGGTNEMDAEMLLAAKELQKMEEKKKKKKADRAQRRAGPSAPSRREKGDAQDDGGKKLSKDPGANPFKKQNIVSKFDVNDIRKVEFVGSYVDDESAWPKTTLPEIAFLGRSNVGKSSMLNTLFGESVAKVSKTPGRTRQINIFKAKNSKGRDVCYFADLPGYGYAKMGKDIQRTIETFLEMYLARRANLKLLVLLTDARREPLTSDAGVLEYAEDREDRAFKILVVATKVDKLNTMESVVNIKKLQEAFDLPPGLPVQFSAVTGVGKKEVWSYIRQAAAAKSI